jgi:hypothetical protein
VVKRRVYDRPGAAAGPQQRRDRRIVDERLYDYAARRGLLPPRAGCGSLARLQYFGLVAEDVARRWRQLLLIGATRQANDTRGRRRAKALLDAVRAGAARRTHAPRRILSRPGDFYDKLRNLDAEAQSRICMTSVLRTNQLLQDPPLYMAQRRDARFINTGMMVSLSGAVTSDALEDGTVISGVGGQYNFVAMAHDLPGARSVLCIRATRHSHGDKVLSNIVPHYGHVTIPRHLRDIVVTEYGVADLRGQSDAEVIKRLLAVCDSRFPGGAARVRQDRRQDRAGLQYPAEQRYNTPARDPPPALRGPQAAGCCRTIPSAPS